MRNWALQIKALIAMIAIAGVLMMPQWMRLQRDQPVQQQHRPAVIIRTMRNISAPEGVRKTIDRLRAANVSEAWVQFKQDEWDEVRGGELFYPSDHGPVAPGFEDDRIGRLVEGLAAAGIKVCAWVPCLNDSAAWEAHEDWRAWMIDSQGNVHEQENWLCPSSEEVRAYEAEIVGEIAERYPKLSALYTDFIRYDNDLSCACQRCMSRMRDRFEDDDPDRPAGHADIARAAQERSEVWQEWTDMRAETICEVVESLRDSIEEVRPDLWFGACVLPFSAKDYKFNTQSGQDYYEMARVGLDEIAVMGYWDDWQKSPEWLIDSLVNARQLVQGECELSCIIDGDMSIRRTWLTLDAIRDAPLFGLRYFNYWEWTAKEFDRITASERGARLGGPPKPEATAVVIRIDTEPDYQRRYDTLQPSMITELVEMFDAEGVKTTFVTCGTMAELQPDAVRYAAAQGHEIACHAYDHEQLDDLSPEDERRVILQGLEALKKAGLEVHGFGAPRNSITESGRNVLIELGLEYDGSGAYDPMHWLQPVDYAAHTSGDGRKILVLPFIMPNDWDALHVDKVSVDEMLRRWQERLDRVVEIGEPAFVLDVHQWMTADPAERRALRDFIRYAKAKTGCRLMTLRDAAAHSREYIDQVEFAASKSLESSAGERSP